MRTAPNSQCRIARPSRHGQVRSAPRTATDVWFACLPSARALPWPAAAASGVDSHFVVDNSRAPRANKHGTSEDVAVFMDHQGPCGGDNKVEGHVGVIHVRSRESCRNRSSHVGCIGFQRPALEDTRATVQTIAALVGAGRSLGLDDVSRRDVHAACHGPQPVHIPLPTRTA